MKNLLTRIFLSLSIVVVGGALTLQLAIRHVVPQAAQLGLSPVDYMSRAISSLPPDPTAMLVWMIHLLGWLFYIGTVLVFGVALMPLGPILLPEAENQQS